MDVLRHIRRTRGYLGNISLRRRNAITSVGTYCASTRLEPHVTGSDERGDNSERAKEISRPTVTVDETTIRKIERLALVGFDYEHSKRVLEEAIAFAERLRRARIDETVRPMYSTLENEHIHLRDDVAIPRDVTNRRDVLRNAALLEEEYFVAPLSTGRNTIEYGIFESFKFYQPILRQNGQLRCDTMNLEAILRLASPYFLTLLERSFTYGPQGRLLLKNLEDHWFAHCVTMPRYNVFLCDVSIGDTLHLLQSCSMDSMPFALATFANSKGLTWNESLLNDTGQRIASHKTAKINVIVDASESKNLLHKKQRERKVWWRKLAQCPSRFMLVEAKKAKNLDAMEIQAQFPFGNITVETISHHPNVRKLYSQNENSKEIAADMHMIEHVTSLDWGCLALLCDSHTSNNSSRAYIHPKLSPYKTTFHIVKQKNETDTDVEDLSRFILYLNNMLRTKGIHTICSIFVNMEHVVEMCLIPFVVSVDKTSLKNGIVYVENRATTLKEAVHITDLAKYITTRST